MSLGDKVLTARKSKGLTQEQLAERAALTVRTIQRIENDDSIPRDYTLKAIASALHIPVEEFMPISSCLRNHIDTNPVLEEMTPAAHREENCHFLQLLNLSAFSYLVIPFVHFLIPIFLLKKKKEELRDNAIQSTGRKIIRHQIYWTIATHLLLFLTLVYNLVLASWFGKSNLLNYVWIFAGMYLINAVIIGRTAIRLRNNSRTAYINN